MNNDPKNFRQFAKWKERTIPEWADQFIPSLISDEHYLEFEKYWQSIDIPLPRHSAENLPIEKQIEMEEYFHETLYTHIEKSRHVLKLHTRQDAIIDIYLWIYYFRKEMDLLATMGGPGKSFYSLSSKKELHFQFFDIKTYIYEVIESKGRKEIGEDRRFYKLNSRAVYYIEYGHFIKGHQPVKLLYFNNYLAFSKNLKKQVNLGDKIINLKDFQINRTMKPALEIDDLDILLP